MAPKRPLETAESGPERKKHRPGFKVGPDNLPDGPWRRKVTKIKRDLITKAKVKKAYAKVKVRERPADAGHDEKETEEPEEQIHPARQLMLKDEDNAQIGAAPQNADAPDGHRRRTRRPGYYDKQLEKAEEVRVETERRQQEMQRRREERERKLAERDRFKKAMAKTRGRDGKKKLGRESSMLLDKVKRLYGDQ